MCYQNMSFCFYHNCCNNLAYWTCFRAESWKQLSKLCTIYALYTLYNTQTIWLDTKRVVMATNRVWNYAVGVVANLLIFFLDTTATNSSFHAPNESTGLYGRFYIVRLTTLQQQRYAGTRHNVIVSVKSKQKSRSRPTRRVKTMGKKGRICGMVIWITQYDNRAQQWISCSAWIL